MKYTRPTFSRMALRLIKLICLWHSWTTCLRTESFLKPFGLQDLRIFLRLIFFLWGAMKNSVHSNNPHTIDELKMTIRVYIRHVDRAIPNTVFDNTVRHVNKCLETGGGHLNITCNFLCCNHQVHRSFMITLYLKKCRCVGLYCFYRTKTYIAEMC